MAENPIRTSDLFEDDGVIRDLIAQLQKMDTHLKEIGQAYIKVAKDIKQSTDQANATQKEGQKVIQQNTQEAKQLQKATENLSKAKTGLNKEVEKLNVAAKEQAQLSKAQIKAEHEKTAESKKTREELVRIKTETQEQMKITKELVKSDIAKTEAGKKARLEVMKAKEEQRLANQEAQNAARINMYAEGSYNQLAAQYAQVKKELNEMSHEQRFNTDQGRQMESQAKALYNQMNRMQMATGVSAMQVGSYTEAIQKSNMSMKEMQDELKLLKEMSFEGMSTAEIRDVEQAIGELTDRMQKYKYEVEAYGMDTFEMISGSARGAAASIQLVAGSFNLLGIESKHLQTVQQNIYSMMAVTTALQQLEQVYHKGHIRILATKVRGIGVWVKETIAKKYNAAQTWLNIRAQKAQAKTTVATTATTGASAVATTTAATATGLWTMAVRAFSRAIYGIPVFGWLLAIIGAIIAAVTLLIRHWERVVGLFRSVGQWLGIVSKETNNYEKELRKAEEAQRRLNLEMEASTRAIERLTRAEQRRIELLRAAGAATGQIAKAEKELMEAQLKNARHRTDIARQQMLQQSRILYLMREMGKSEEDIAEQREKLQDAREAYYELRDSVEDIEHSLQVHHTNEQRRIRERMESEAQAARDKLIAEKRASLELAVIRARREMEEAKSDKAREDAALKYMNTRQRQISELAKLELEGVTDPIQRQLIMERANAEIRKISDEHFTWLYDREKERFALLINLTQTEEQKRLTELRKTYDERVKLAGDDKELLLAIEKWYSDELEDIANDRRVRQRQAEEQALNDRLDLEESQFNTIYRTRAEQEKFRLQQDLEYYRERIEIHKKYGGLLTDNELAIMENLIEETKRKLEELKQVGHEDFWEMVGIQMKPATKDLIQQSTQFALDNIAMVIQARQEQADAAVAAAQSEVDAARQAYETEKQLMEDGQANRMEDAEQQLRVAEQQQKRAEQMQEKERARQARLEGLTQAGNLLVASTRILAQYGIPMALPFLALMWGTFYAQRRKARQAATEMYGKGHFEVIGGGSHASGKDTALGIDGKNRRVERGEAFAVFNKKATSTYGSNVLGGMVKRINTSKGDINDIFVRELLGADVRGFVEQNMTLTQGGTSISFDTTGLQAGISKLVEQNTEKTYIDNLGRLVKEKNNTRRIYV